MSGKAIFAIILMSGLAFGCGALFFGVGLWAAKNIMPAHFWSGSTVDPKTVTDIPAYNRANARCGSSTLSHIGFLVLQACSALWLPGFPVCQVE